MAKGLAELAAEIGEQPDAGDGDDAVPPVETPAPASRGRSRSRKGIGGRPTREQAAAKAEIAQQEQDEKNAALIGKLSDLRRRLGITVMPLFPVAGTHIVETAESRMAALVRVSEKRPKLRKALEAMAEGADWSELVEDVAQIGTAAAIDLNMIDGHGKAAETMQLAEIVADLEQAEDELDNEGGEGDEPQPARPRRPRRSLVDLASAAP